MVTDLERGCRFTFDRAPIHEVIRGLRNLGIESTIGTYGLHLELYFRDLFTLIPSMYPNVTIAARQSLSLPLFPDMSDSDVGRVVDTVSRVVGQ